MSIHDDPKLLERVRDLLCAAFEGGSNYWIKYIQYFELPQGTTIDDFREDGRMQGADYYPPTVMLPTTPGGAIKLWVDEPGREPCRLDLGVIASGLDTMRLDYAMQYEEWEREDDDAATADVFLQCCLFGEVIFG